MINKQAYFTVKFAKNISRYSPQEQQQALNQLPPKGAALVRSAQQVLTREVKHTT